MRALTFLHRGGRAASSPRFRYQHMTELGVNDHARARAGAHSYMHAYTEATLYYYYYYYYYHYYYCYIAVYFSSVLRVSQSARKRRNEEIGCRERVWPRLPNHPVPNDFARYTSGHLDIAHLSSSPLRSDRVRRLIRSVAYVSSYRRKKASSFETVLP